MGRTRDLTLWLATDPAGALAHLASTHTLALAACALAWLACAVLGYGFWLGFFQTEYPDRPGRKPSYRGDVAWGLVQSLGGPFSLFAVWLNGHTVHGLRFR